MADPVLPPEPAYFVDPAGRTVEVPADQVPAAVEAGLVPASAEAAMEFERQVAINREYGGVGGQVATGAAAAGRTLTFGLSDQVLTGTGLVQEQTLKDMREVNPTADTVGTVAGVVAPALLSGGASLGAQAAGAGVRAGAKAGLSALAKQGAQKALSVSGPALATRAGLAVERVVGAALPEATSLVGQTARALATKGAGSAVEGAFYGAGNVVSEHALGDPHLTAESAAAEIGLSALMGGVLGGAFGATEVVIPAAVSRAREAIGTGSKRLFAAGTEALAGAEGLTGTRREVTELLLEQRTRLEALEKAAPGITGKAASASSPETARVILDNAVSFGELEAAFPAIAKGLPQQTRETAERVLANWREGLKDPRVLEDVAKQTARALDETIAAVEAAKIRALKDVIPTERAELVAKRFGDSVEKAQEEAVRLAGRFDDALTTIRADRDSYDQALVKKLTEMRDGLFERTTREGVKAADIADEILHTRRLLDDRIKYKKPIAMMSTVERNTDEVLSGLRREIKAATVSEDVFGAAGVRQAALDKAQSEYIGALEHLLGETTGGFKGKKAKIADFVGGKKGRPEIDPTKIKTWLEKMADIRGQAKTEAIRTYMEKAAGLLDEIENSYRAAPVGDFDRKGLAALMEKTQKTVAETEKRASITQTMREVEQQGVQRAIAQGPSADASLMAAAANAVLPGVVTSTAKATIDTVKSVPTAVRTLAALERMAQRSGEAIERGVSMIVRGSVRATYVGRGEAAAGLGREFAAPARSARRLYEKRIAEISELSTDIEQMQSRLADQAAAMEGAPDTSVAVGATTTRAVMFLASKIPQHPKRGPLAADWVPSQAEIAKFNRYYEAVDNPMVVLKQVAAGTLTAEAVEAIRTVYPLKVEQIAAALMAKIAERNNPLPYRTRLMLGMLLQQDLDGTTSPESIRATQASFGPSVSPQSNAAPAPQRPGFDGLTMSSRLLTPSQEARQRR